jgi:hypothetical protein
MHRRRSLSTDTQDNGEELRISQGVGTLRQQPFARSLTRRPVDNPLPDRLSAHVASP